MKSESGQMLTEYGLVGGRSGGAEAPVSLPCAMMPKRAAGNRQLATAICVSFLLHVTLLTVYNPWNSAGDQVPPTSPWSRHLDVTMRAPQSVSVGVDQDTNVKRQSLVNAPIARKNPAALFDRGEESGPIPSHITVPFFPTEAGDSGAVIEPSSAIDMDAARDIARQTERNRSQGRVQGRNIAPPLVLQNPPVVERETPLSRAIARSAHSDCRTAYAGAGLFAIPFLVRDAVTGSGCRW